MTIKVTKKCKLAQILESINTMKSVFAENHPQKSTTYSLHKR